MDLDTKRECDECPGMLSVEGILDEKSFKKWSLKNHPDKFPGLNLDELSLKQNKYGKISSCIDTIYKYDKCKKSEIIPKTIERKVTDLEMFRPKVTDLEMFRPKVTDLKIFRPKVEMKVSHILGRTLSPFRSVSPLFCPTSKVFRSGYTTRKGVRVSPVCAKKKSKRRTARRTKRRSCSKSKSLRRGYLRSNGKRVKSSCVKKPLKCSRGKSRRRSYTTKRGARVKSSCVRRRRS